MGKVHEATQIGKAGEAAINIFKGSDGKVRVEANYPVKDANGNVLFHRTRDITGLLTAAMATTIAKAYDDMLNRVEGEETV